MGAIRIRTERVNEEITIRILHISMQNCKSIVAMVFECYFFITSSCIVIHVHACVITQYGSTVFRTVYIGMALVWPAL